MGVGGCPNLTQRDPVMNPEMKQRVNGALAVAFRYGGIDGDHHKQWVIAQIVRVLTGTKHAYDRWVASRKSGKDGPETYSWEEGIAP